MENFQGLIIPRGFRAGAVKAGIKPSGGLDLALLAAAGPCTAATFTTNRVCAAPVRWCRDHLQADDIRAVVVNAGNANAATGIEGAINAARTAEVAGYMLGCRRPGPGCLDRRYRPPAPDGPGGEGSERVAVGSRATRTASGPPRRPS